MELPARTTSGWITSQTPREIAPGTTRSLLFFGPDRGGLVEFARKAAGTGEREQFDITRTNPDTIISSLSSESLFGGAGTVILYNAGDGQHQKIEKILSGPFCDGARLIVLAGELKPASKLRKLYKDNPDIMGVPLYTMRAGEIGKFARSFFRAHGFGLSRDAEPALASRLSGDRGQATRACETVLLHALGKGHEQVAANDVRAILDTVDEEGLTAPIDHALLEDAGSALAALQVRLNSGDSAIRMLRVFATRIHRIRELLATGLSPGDAVARAKPPVFWAERDLMARLVSALTPAKARRLTCLIDRTEYTIIERGTPDLPGMSALLLDIAHHATWKAPS